MKVKHSFVLALAAALMFSGPASAANTPKTKGKPAICLIAGYENPPSVCVVHTKVVASTCYNCHGPNGKSSTAIPALVGQDKNYFVTAMKEFRDGKREATVMQKYALGFTDEEFESMGEFFAKIK